jgi:chromosome segregation protein
MPVFLKKIELFGFKSFADRTKVEFVSTITGIVGPNGSGKSNIIDAIRWCLGENSPKTLRSSGFEDILFSGSQYRQPLSVAEVSLLFDNSTRILPIPLDEVEITKRYYRSGETKTLINRNETRVKDVINLFLGTGFGKEGYSIIGQDEVDKLVVGDPSEKRNYIDELLGISKAKFKKGEAEKRLKEIILDLEKIFISLEQTEREYFKLKEQSEKAKKYKELQNQIELYEKAINRFNLEKYKQKLNTLEKEKSKAIDEIEEILKRIGEIESKIKDVDNELQTYSAILEEKRRKLGEVEKNISEKEVEKREILSKVELSNRLIDSLEKEKDNLETRKKILLEEREVISSKLSKILEIIPEISQKASNLEEEIKRLSKELTLNEEERAKIYELVNFCNKTLKDLEITENEISSSLARETEIETEISSLTDKISDLKSKLSDIEIQKEDKTIKIENLREQREELKEQITQLKKYIATSSDVIKETQNMIKELTTESQKLFDEFSKEIGRNALIVGDFIKRAKEISKLIINKCELIANSPEPAKIAEEIKDSANELLNSLSLLPSSISSDFFTKREKIDKEISSLRSKLETLVEEVESQKNHLSELTEKLNIIEKNIFSLEREFSFLEREFKTLEQNIISYEEELNYKYDELEKLKTKRTNLIKKRTEIVTKTIETLSAYSTSAYSTSTYSTTSYNADILKTLKADDEEFFKLRKVIEEILKNLDFNIINNSINQLKHQINQRLAEFNQLQNSLTKAQTEKENISNRLDNIEKEVKEINNRISKIESETKEHRENIEKLKLLLPSKEEEISKLKNSKDELLKEIGEYSVKVKELNEVFKNYIKELNTLKDEEINKNKVLHELIGKIEITNNQIEKLKNSIFEKYGSNIETIELPKDFEPNEYHRRLENLKREINNLVNVNFSAIDELPEVEERYKFLKFNYDDLLQSKEKLEGVISDINKEIETIISSSIQKVEEVITTVFKEVFGGGGVKIELDNNDLVEGGIEFIVNIPGKKIKNILLLSGGEKALVSIILIFSALMIKNTPLVILDEVDAPLDDENNERFKRLIKAFESKTQFIIISHNKSTLDICNTIYGVTMEEKGVSKVVSYQLKNAEVLF